MAQLADQLTEEQIEEIVKRQLKKLDDQYEEVHKYDIKAQPNDGTPNVDSLKKAEEEMEQEELGEYQAIGEADAGLFDDQDNNEAEEGDSGNPQISKNEEQSIKQQFMEVPPETPTQFPPVRDHDVDLEKAQKIANTFCLEMPSWASDPQQCRIRLQKLFNKY